MRITVHFGTDDKVLVQGYTGFQKGMEITSTIQFSVPEGFEAIGRSFTQLSQIDKKYKKENPNWFKEPRVGMIVE
jgi:hypothetical protein